MPSNIDIFHTPRARLSRAREQIASLKGKLTEYHTSCCDIVIEQDPVTLFKTHKLKLVRQIPDEIAIIAHEICEALRAVLDNTGYASARALGKNNPKRAYFPVADTAAELDPVKLSGKKGKCKDLDSRVLDLFLSFEPTEDGKYRLWFLNKVANSSKHALLQPMAVLVGNQFTGSFNNDGLTVELCVPPVWDIAANEMTLCIVDDGSNPQYQSNFSVETLLLYKNISAGRCDRALTILANDVEEVINATVNLVGTLQEQQSAPKVDLSIEG